MIRHLFVPGLLGPLDGPAREQLPSLPHIETVLARADRLSEPVGYADALFALFGVTGSPRQDLPTAAVSLLADTGEAATGFVLHADPLHLVPDRDHVLAFRLDDDPLDDAECDELIRVFNSHYLADGLRLCAGRSGRFFLTCEQEASIQTHPLSKIIGRNLDPWLPHGEDSRWWRGLLNETQMLCHSLAFNQRREQTGRATLGGLWFSGCGRLPSVNKTPVARVIGDCSLARGLLALSAGSGEDELMVERGFEEALQRVDSSALLREIGRLEQRLPEILRDSDELHLHPCTGVAYRWHAGAARRWWRRRRRLATYAERPSGDTAPIPG